MVNPPVKLEKIAIGDGTIGSQETAILLPVVSNDHVPASLLLTSGKVSVLETYPQIIGYDTGVFDFFKEQYALIYILNLRIGPNFLLELRFADMI